MKELADAYQRADSLRENDPDYDHLTQVLYDLYSFFSEEGITSNQRDRLKEMGFPSLQDIPCQDCGCFH